jgi:hypothetical protein
MEITMATLLNHLSGLFQGLLAASSAPRRTPSLLSLNLSDHDLADLNLPAGYRGRREADRARDAARYGTFL